MTSTTDVVNLTLETIDFGVVSIGKKCRKNYVVENLDRSVLHFVVQRSSITNPIYYVFDVDKYEGSIEPHQKCTIRITYTPNVPGEKSIDYFGIIKDRKFVTKLCFRGECIGPNVNLSLKYHTFYVTATQDNRLLKFIISNSTRVPVLFQFDENDGENETFRISTLKGTLGGNTHKYLSCTFAPPRPGVFAKQVVCLIQNHKPKMLNLLGINLPKSRLDSPRIRHYPFPLIEAVGFRGYLQDTVNITSFPPPVSLSQIYLDFKKYQPNAPCTVLTTSFTNNFDTEVKVVWENGENFEIAPQEITIPGHKSILYEVNFRADETHKLYAMLMRGNVYWTGSFHADSLTVPLAINLRMIGHSFPENESWTPLLQIKPSPVVLPVTVPSYPSFTTFSLIAGGVLPILFRMLPPPKSKFLMKPMVGIVRQYQIITVQTETDENETGFFIEKWHIELNGNPKRFIPLYVKVQVELPSILIGSSNFVKFDAVSPGSQGFVDVQVKNISNCHLRFKFLQGEDFGCEPETGELVPNEEINSRWWCLPMFEDTKRYETICKITGFSGCADVDGIAYVDVPITVEITCIYSELCALPKSHDFGHIEFGSEHKFEFDIYNFGESPVIYKLLNETDDKHNVLDVVITPLVGKCNSKQMIHTKVVCSVKKIGRNRIRILYMNRINEGSDAVMKGNAIELVVIEYQCVFALLQITDIVDQNFGNLFTKNELWDFFKIDEYLRLQIWCLSVLPKKFCVFVSINGAFSNLEYGETAAIFITVPDHELQPHMEFYAKFQVKNIGKFDTSLVYRRHKNCDCLMQEVGEGLTQRKQVFSCPHKEAFSISITDNFIMSKSKQYMTFTLEYNLPDEILLTYSIDLTCNRHIYFNVSICVINPSQPVLSLYNLDNRFCLKHIYIGLREPPVQAFWIYNNTSKATPYKIDDRKIKKLNYDEGFPILTCLNTQGYLKPFTRAPLLFKFWPIENRDYFLQVDMMMGMRIIKVTIEGSGTDTIDKYHELVDKPPSLSIGNKYLSLSRDNIFFDPIVVSDTKEQMFFVTNISKNNTIKYSWKADFVDGLIKIDFLSPSSLITTKESQSVVVKVTSLCEPCIIRVFITCEMYNYEQFLLFEKYKADVKAEIERVDAACSVDSPQREIKPVIGPRTHKITIPLTLYAIGMLDKDTCLELPYQMWQKPNDELIMNLRPMIRRYFRENMAKDTPLRKHTKKKADSSALTLIDQRDDEIDVEMTRAVLDSIISNAVFANYFKERIMELKVEPNPLYQQVKVKNPNANIRLINAFSRKLHLPQLSDIFQEVIVDSVHEAFQLGPVMKSNDKLIRSKDTPKTSNL